MDDITVAASQLNFHHLRYFWMVANEGHLTRVATQLRVSQSALSSQIRQLEAHLEEPLFERTGRRLVLTEAGKIVLGFADDIFGAGGRMVATLRTGRHRGDMLRIGAVSTLSRNFQDSFVKPLFGVEEARMQFVSGSMEELLERLASHRLDLVLGNRLVNSVGDQTFRCLRVARQEVSLVGPPGPDPLRFPDDLAGVSLLVPTTDSAVRTSFDALCDRLGVTPLVVAEVDDMALLRLLARDTGTVALLPSVVVRDELMTGVLQEHCVVPDLYESFYATTVPRRFPHPLVEALLARTEEELLAMGV